MPTPVPFVANPVQSWGSDPSWLTMDASARGFHTQLLLVAARQKPAGFLPDDDDAWRRWLNLPAAWPAEREDEATVEGSTVGKTLRKFFEEPTRKGQGVSAGMLEALRTVWEPADGVSASAARGSYERWIDHLWVTRWKPMVVAAWSRIDAELAATRPYLTSKVGGFWNPVAETLGGVALGMPSLGQTVVAPPLAPGQTGSATTKGRKKRAGLDEPLPSPLITPGMLGWGDVGSAGAWWLDTDTSSWRDLGKVARCWRVPVTTERRRSLWEVGASCLAVDLADQAKARTFLGKLIRQYGEEKVAKGVAELSMRALPPADGYSFLQGILRRETEGSEAEQRARHQRARVAL